MFMKNIINIYEYYKTNKINAYKDFENLLQKKL